ncbi:MAG: 4-(cytidine 5'-diphospho)-2-C-methyl-D-erythritol kinase [Ruminococcaceae bacterium]|nr:4-(cytidine 5'-diphospho)-2-C-methyl-D-erythritol kinase [Oscillospiraceae bacterium]
MKEITLPAYAKINLHLDVTSRLDNGYHEVSTVMQSVSLCDEVTVGLCEDGGISISCDVDWLPTDSRNLAWRAADLFFERCGFRKGVRIKIVKRIPAAAGLAGGSTDAAAVLLALNALCGYPIDRAELLGLAAKLGADLPFCVAGGVKYADGFGEKLHAFPKIPHCYLVIAVGREGVSTPWAYKMLDERYGGFEDDRYLPRSLSGLRLAVELGDIAELSKNIYNIFESVIEPERAEVTHIKRELLESGAVGAMMSGSGPSVFGMFESESDARRAAESLREKGISAFAAEPVYPDTEYCDFEKEI